MESGLPDIKRELWGLFRRCAMPGSSLVNRVLDVEGFKSLIASFDVSKIGGSPYDGAWVNNLWQKLVAQESTTTSGPVPVAVRWPTLWKVIKGLLTGSPSPPRANPQPPLQLTLDVAGLQGVLSTSYDFEPLMGSPPRHSVGMAPSPKYENRRASSPPIMTSATGESRHVSPMRRPESPRPARLEINDQSVTVDVSAGLVTTPRGSPILSPCPPKESPDRLRLSCEECPKQEALTASLSHDLEASFEEIAELRAHLSSEQDRNKALISQGHVQVADAIPTHLPLLSQVARCAADVPTSGDGWVVRKNYNELLKRLDSERAVHVVEVSRLGESLGQVRGLLAERDDELIQLQEETSMLHSEAQYRDELLAKVQSEDKSKQLREQNHMLQSTNTALLREIERLKGAVSARDVELTASRTSVAEAEDECKRVNKLLASSLAQRNITL